jgi:hypothetical protein
LNSQYLHTKPMQRIGLYVLHPDTENKRGVSHMQRGDTKRADGRTRAFAPRKTERKYAATTARRSDDYSNGRNAYFQIIVTL